MRTSVKYPSAFLKKGSGQAIGLSSINKKAKAWLNPGSLALLLFLCLVPLHLAEANSSLRAAKQAFSRGKWGTSYSLFQEAAKKQPRSGEPFFYMAYIREKQDREAEAVLHYQKAIGLRLDKNLKQKAFWKITLYYKKNHDWANLLLYSNRFLEFNDHKAVRKLRDLAQGHNRSGNNAVKAKVLLEQALAQKQEGSIEQAILGLEQLISLYPKHTKAHWELALLRIGQQDFLAAVKHLSLLVQASPEDWQYQYKASICYYRLGQHQQAFTHLKKAQELYQSSHTKENQGLSFYVNYVQGDIYLQQQQFKKAIRYFLSAGKIRNLTKIDASLARSHWGLGKYEKAGQYAQASVDRNPPQAMGYLILALQAYKKQQVKQAYKLAQEMKETLDEDPKQAQISVNTYSFGFLLLGQKASRKKDWKQALTVLKKVQPQQLSLFAKGAKTASPLKLLKKSYPKELADALMHNEKPRQALFHYKKLANTPEILFARARCHASLFHASKAKLYLQKAARKKSDLWGYAWTDKAFQALMKRNPEFRQFLSQKINLTNTTRED